MSLECGHQCLIAACLRAGISVGSGDIVEVSEDPAGAVTLAGLARAARKLGFRATPDEWSVNELFAHGAELVGKTILQMAYGYGFMLLTGMTKESITITLPGSPGEACRCMAREELALSWSGRLLVLRGVPGGR